ncbi:MAG: hypothetical protein H6719_27205 [Sandaracinaceae bacterium]|nr:hypothetical protein [Sandaracinaceae bacterium]
MRHHAFWVLAASSLFAAGCDCEGTVPATDAGSPPRDAGGGMDSGTIDDDGGPPPPMDAGFDAAGPVCGDLMCMIGERCEMSPAPTCVPNECADLTCAPTERCAPAPVGPGNVCVDNSCSDSVDCPTEEHCAGGVCVADVCVPGTQTCTAAGEVSECAADGSGTAVRYRCGSDAYFTSACTVDGTEAYCPCRDDWDCPSNTECDVDRCVGTGVAPTCLLPPAPFTDVLPSLEPGFPWGGTDRGDRDATGSPFPSSSQVVMTPLVANLDDDNGDGLIDERDFPEIIFMTFCGSDYTNNGVLRAVHGGGPARGGDFFATCGATEWHEGDALSVSCACSAADLDSSTTLAAGDLDGDGVPEIVGVLENDRIRIYSNRGVPIVTSSFSVSGGNPSVAIANVDGVGLAEILVGNRLYTLEHDASGAIAFVDEFRGARGQGDNGQGPISCIADLDGDGRQELIGGSTVHRLPNAPAGATRRADCTGSETDPDEVEWCAGRLVEVWDGRAVNGAPAERDGFCAVADVWGADPASPPGPDNRPDGVPEVITIAAGRLQIYDSRDGTLIDDRNLPGGRGGAPNVDDFDGDGFPEIGTAFDNEYVLVDLQPPTGMCPAWPTVFRDDMTGLQGNPARTPPTTACATAADCGDVSQLTCNPSTSQCVCLHNGWMRRTEDDSSQVTGSSVFDFNGDGSAEVIYNDECYFRVYAGIDGTVYFKENSPSRTRTENPVVADVDNDGNAEIVFAASNESGFCSEGNDFNNGIEVWGDASDTWVSARRIYNQHAYHVTNVYESGGVPAREPESWRPWNGRLYNTYRSQPRQPFGIAPDLQVGAVQISSPDATCGTLSTTIDITVRVVNAGDLRVGPDVLVGFHGEWTAGGVMEPLYADAAMTPLTTTLGAPLEPGGERFVTVRYDAAFNSPGVLPDRVRVVVDEGDRERECREDNNESTVPVMAGAAEPDLLVELGVVGGVCPVKTFETTLRNVGAVPVSNVTVRYYAGDPATGGTPIHDELVPGPIPAGGMVTFTATIAMFPARDVVVFVVADPDDAIAECNDGNNDDMTDDRVLCSVIF